MELEEMQAVWSQMSDHIEKQKKLTDKMIIMMTKEQYRKKINKVAYPEMIGTIICFATAILIIINFKRLDNWYTLLSGSISLVILIILPVLSLRALHKMQNISIGNNNYKETIIDYNRSKKEFQLVTKLGFYLGFVLMLVIMPVAAKILNNKDLFTTTKSIWPIVICMPLVIIFFIVFAKWVGKCYMNTINSAETLFKELEEEK